MQTNEIIRDSISTGEILLIKYHGGSKPGSVRRILPIKMEENGKLRARCYTSNAVKSFVVDKIEIMPFENEKDLKEWTNLTFESIESFVEFLNSNDEFSEFDISLQKNIILAENKDKRVKLSYSGWIKIDSIDGFDIKVKGETAPNSYNEEGATRPWVVSMTNEIDHTFKTLNSAAVYFMNCLEKMKS